jgi:hypothetical protein
LHSGLSASRKAGRRPTFQPLPKISESKSLTTNELVYFPAVPVVYFYSALDTKRRADLADAAARATVRVGAAIQQLRGAIPSDAAPHTPPPPLNTEGHE